MPVPSESPSALKSADSPNIAAAIDLLRGAIEAQTAENRRIAIYNQNMAKANEEEKGSASLARFIFSANIPLLVAAAGAGYAAHSGIRFGLVVAEILSFVGALFPFMCLVSSGDRWKHRMIALSNAIEFEKHDVRGGLATSLRDLYMVPSWLPGRPAAAGAAAATFWLIVYLALVWNF